MNGSGKSASITGLRNCPAASEGLGEPAASPVASEPAAVADASAPNELPADAGAGDRFDALQPTRTAIRTATIASRRLCRSGRRVGSMNVTRIWFRLRVLWLDRDQPLTPADATLWITKRWART